MKPIFRNLFAAALLVTLGAGPGTAATEQQLIRSIHLPAAAADVATTPDGQRTFVLLAGGKVQIYDAAGKLLGLLTVPATASALSPSADGSQLFVTAGDELQVVAVTTVHQIDLTGAPVRGPADAPVTVVVFNDFQ